ncbi:hypothetical protein NPIL_675641, partial [Nephila pilipes]
MCFLCLCVDTTLCFYTKHLLTQHFRARISPTIHVPLIVKVIRSYSNGFLSLGSTKFKARDAITCQIQQIPLCM